MSGHLCGVFLQPYFGSWSDQVRSPRGRRKPFIIAGTLALILLILSLDLAESTARFSVAPSATKEIYRACLVTIAMLSTLAIWVAVQPVQIGLRTLVTGDCTKVGKAKANAWAGVYSNLAAALVNLPANLDFLPHAIIIDNCGHTVFVDMRLLALTILTVTMIGSYVSVRETRPDAVVFFPIGRSTSYETSIRAAWRLLFEPSSHIRTIALRSSLRGLVGFLSCTMR